jgi:hypothetical protein
VKFFTTSKQHRKSIVAAAFLMLVLWLGTFALTALPELHILLHKDAQTLDHNCLITQLQQHSFTATGVTLVVQPICLNHFAPACAAEFQFLPTGDYLLLPGRAPPALSSSALVVG